jgi:hypothetical protein
MLGRSFAFSRSFEFEPLAAFDLTGALLGWVALGVITLLLFIYAIVAVGRRLYGRIPIGRIALVFVLAVVAAWALNEFEQRELATERQMIEKRAFALASLALIPGSALACLDPVVGAVMDDTCEKRLFASSATTATAVSYVAAQLSLLAAASEHARRNGASDDGSTLTSLRRSLEADRFGIVAHVLAARDGCTPHQCAALALLASTGPVSRNLEQRPFDRYL